MTGRVKALRDSYGFITADDGSKFFYHSDDQVDDFDLLLGDEVRFTAEDPPPAQGPRARGVAFLAAGGSM